MEGTTVTIPDFAALYPVKKRRALTPRNAFLLWDALSVIADEMYDEIDEVGSATLQDSDVKPWLTSLPQITWRRDAAWRRKVAHAADDLRRDLETGHFEGPRCTADEVVLYLAVEFVNEDDARDQDVLDKLPESAYDEDWDRFVQLAFQDLDFRLLYNPRFDGIEDPDFELNRYQGMANLSPEDWFEPFGNVTPRDPHRGFRR